MDASYYSWGFYAFGVLIRFIPYPVTTGFTAGIATVIFASQIKDFCGFDIAAPDASFIEGFHSMFNIVTPSISPR